MTKVFINPGHDTKLDSGAVSPRNNSVHEADIVRRVGYAVKEYLERVGVSSDILQSDNLAGEDYYSYEGSVCDTANKSGARLFISIHCNSALNQEASGCEVLIVGKGGEREHLAECLQWQLVKSLCLVDRGIKIRPDLLVLEETDMPAVLVELGFLSNEEDEELLTTREDDFARAIARGVTDHLGTWQMGD